MDALRCSEHGQRYKHSFGSIFVSSSSWDGTESDRLRVRERVVANALYILALSVRCKKCCAIVQRAASTSCWSMRKRKYDGLVPDHFKELVRDALQKPKVALQSHCAPSEITSTITSTEITSTITSTEITSKQRDSLAVIGASTSSNVTAAKPLAPPKIPSISFYSAKDAVTPPPPAAASAIATCPRHGTSVGSTPTDPEYLRLIQLYKKRCSLFGAERRQHCFQMFAKLKEALVYASQQSNCHVFAQEGGSARLFFI